MSPRFIAYWIAAQYVNEDGEWEPDRDTLGFSVHTSLEDAQAVSIANSKRLNVCEWVRVIEEHFNPDLGISPLSEAAWDIARTWHGDWDGHWIES